MSCAQKIIISTSDKVTFVVAISLARRCALFERILARGPLPKVVPLAIHSSMMAKIIDFLEHYTQELSGTARAANWFFEFMEANINIIEDIFETSNYLGLAPLSELCLRKFDVEEEPIPCSSRSVNIRNHYGGRIYSSRPRLSRSCSHIPSKHRTTGRHSRRHASMPWGAGRRDRNYGGPEEPSTSCRMEVHLVAEQGKSSRQLEVEEAMRRAWAHMRIEDYAEFQEQGAALLSSMKEFVSMKNDENSRRNLIAASIKMPDEPMDVERPENDSDMKGDGEELHGEIKQKAVEEAVGVVDQEELYQPPPKKLRIV